MQLRNILREVIQKLGIEDEICLDDKLVTGDTYNKLMMISNNVIRELASSYLPLLMEENIRVEGGKYELTNLKRKAVRVISLKYHGENVKFKMFPTYLYAEDGNYDILYSYLPHTVGLDDEIECDPRIYEDILAAGIISEYSIMRGETDTAIYYDRKYREHLKNLLVTRKEIRIKGRPFI